MNPVSKITTALRFVANHPVNHDRKFRAAFEYGFIQMAAKLIPGEICVAFPNQTCLLVSPRMKGAAVYIAPGLYEFDDMVFVAHFLRPNDLFFDVGANIGAYTVLAAGVAGARVMAFEPSPETFAMLEKNVRLNQLESRAKLFNAALGRSPGEMQFTTGLGTENHVVEKGSSEENGNTVKVKVLALDEMLAQGIPSLLKVDVEGFEVEVMGGAGQLLKHRELSAIILERAGNAGRYRHDEDALHRNVREEGFTPCQYAPLQRQLTPVGAEMCGNIIYVRDVEAANHILGNAPPIKLGKLSV